MNKTIRSVLLPVGIACLMVGCATKTPSFGESVQAEGKAVADIGENWDRGQELVRKGNKRIRKGNEQIEDGNENIAEGRSMVKSGEKLISEAESLYQQSTGNKIGL